MPLVISAPASGPGSVQIPVKSGNWMHTHKPILDLDAVDHARRTEIISPDSGVWTRPDLLKAVYAFGKELVARGATLLVEKIPAGPDGTEQKLDDFLILHSLAELDQLPRFSLKEGAFGKTAQWWRGWQKRKERSSTESRTGSGDKHLTDLGNAKRLVRLHGEDIRFATAFGWLVWDGARWVRDETGEIMRRAKQTVLGGYGDAGNLADDKARHAVLEHLQNSEGEPSLRRMVRRAESEPTVPVRPEELDRDSWALNVLNGTIDLRTGALRPHRRQDLLTKLVPLHYDPTASAPQWEAFLARIFDGNQSLIEFLQRAAGYSLTADTREDVFFLCHGTGANGKTTFLEALAASDGSYSEHARAQILLERKGQDGIPTEIAALLGARFVWAAETEAGVRLAEGLVKSLTGGDTVTARHLYHEPFSFKLSSITGKRRILDSRR